MKAINELIPLSIYVLELVPALVKSEGDLSISMNEGSNPSALLQTICFYLAKHPVAYMKSVPIEYIFKMLF